MALSLTTEKDRQYGKISAAECQDITVKASTSVFVGQVLATDVANHAGKAIPFDNAGTFTTPVFVGFALTSIVQTASSTDKVRVLERGTVLIPTITGASGLADYGVTVYASNDDTFTTTSTSNIAIGKIDGFVSGEGFQVSFEAASTRSI